MWGSICNVCIHTCLKINSLLFSLFLSLSSYLFPRFNVFHFYSLSRCVFLSSLHSFSDLHTVHKDIAFLTCILYTKTVHNTKRGREKWVEISKQDRGTSVNIQLTATVSLALFSLLWVWKVGRVAARSQLNLKWRGRQ
jgi:hypothetical protein